MKKKMIFFLILVIPFKSFSQLSEGGFPESFNGNSINKSNSKSAIYNYNVFKIEDLNTDLEKDKIKQKKSNKGHKGIKYYGKEIEVDIDVLRDAYLSLNKNGDKIYLLKLESNEAEGYQFLFDKFKLPDGCKLYIYNNKNNMVLGAFTSKNNRNSNTFATQHINGEDAFVELFVPKDVKKKIQLSIDRLVYIFDSFAKVGPYVVDEDGVNPHDIVECMPNVQCEAGYLSRGIMKSVVMILTRDSDGELWGSATGVLINKEDNYLDTDKPYFLTANHVYEIEEGNISNCQEWVLLFRHEASSCDSDGSEFAHFNYPTNSVVGVQKLVNGNILNSSDYFLGQLNCSVGDIKQFDIAFAGWDAFDFEEAYHGTATCIHHPLGDVKKVSISSSLISNIYLGGVDIECLGIDDYKSNGENYWEVTWDEGVTAPGSSGSPIFNEFDEVIGLLTGGRSQCKEGLSNGCEVGPWSSDFFGKFSTSFDDGNMGQYLSSNSTHIPAYYPNKHFFGLNVPDISFSESYLLNNSFFYINAKIANFADDLTWFLTINKNPGDLNNYKYGDDDKVYSEVKRTLNGEFESKEYRFNEIGTYKATLFVRDLNGYYANEDFSFNILDTKTECITVDFSIKSEASRFEYPLGGKIKLSPYTYFKNYAQVFKDECHDVFFLGDHWWPNYQGIAKLRWFSNGAQIGDDIVYNSVLGYWWDPDNGEIEKYYSNGIEFIYVDLDNIGTHSFKLESYAGTLERRNSAFYNPLTSTSDYNSIIKSIKVVDLNEKKNYASKSSIDDSNGRIKANVISFNEDHPPASSIDVAIENEEVLLVEAYKEINILPGFHIKAGAFFNAKIIDKPLSDEETSKYSSKRTQLKEVKSNSLEGNCNLEVYPNPSNGIFEIYFKDIEDKGIISVYNMNGSKVLVQLIKDIKSAIDLSSYSNGIYLIKFISKNEIFTKRIVLKK